MNPIETQTFSQGFDVKLINYCNCCARATPITEISPCTWVKTGRFGSFFVLSFLALGGHCLQMLCLPAFGTHANTQILPPFRAFPASTQEHSPPECPFFMANAELPNRPGVALLPVHLDIPPEQKPLFGNP